MIWGIVVTLAAVAVAFVLGVRAAIATLRRDEARVEAWLALGESPDASLRRAGAAPTATPTRRGFATLVGVWGACLAGWGAADDRGLALVVAVMVVGATSIVAAFFGAVRVIARGQLGDGRLPDALPAEAKAAFREDSVPKRPVRGRDC